GKQLLPFGPATGPPHTLLRFARRQLEPFLGRLLALLRLGRASPRRGEQRVRSRIRIERRIGVHRPRGLQQLLTPLRRSRVQEPLGPVETSTRDARDRRRLVLRETRRQRLNLLPHRP